MNDLALTCPASPTPAELADWIEIRAVLDRWPVISHGRIHEAVTAARAFVEPEEISTALRDLRRRASWKSSIYPFERIGSTFRRREHVDPWLYLLLVLFSNPVFTDKLSMQEAREAFEAFCHAWALDFLGGNGKAIMFSPSSPDRPKSFPDAIRWLANQLGLERGIAQAPTSRNDGGVDVVGWVPFPDGSHTSLVLLCQATVRQAYIDKGSDIDLRLWTNWINFLSEPVRVLVVPHAVSRKDTVWTDIRDRGVTLVDRRRLAETYTGRALDEVLGISAEAWVLQAVAD